MSEFLVAQSNSRNEPPWSPCMSVCQSHFRYYSLKATHWATFKTFSVTILHWSGINNKRRTTFIQLTILQYICWIRNKEQFRRRINPCLVGSQIHWWAGWSKSSLITVLTVALSRWRKQMIKMQKNNGQEEENQWSRWRKQIVNMKKTNGQD